MNYSNSQRAGVILYLTALLFGAYVEPAGMSPVGPLFWDEGVKTAFPVSRLPAGKGTRGVADLSAVREFQGFRSDAGIVSLLIHVRESTVKSRLDYREPQGFRKECPVA